MNQGEGVGLLDCCELIKSMLKSVGDPGGIVNCQRGPGNGQRHISDKVGPRVDLSH